MWLDDTAYELVPLINIDNPDNESPSAKIIFKGWSGPMQVALSEGKEAQRLFRPMDVGMQGPHGIGEDTGSFNFIIDLVEGRCWIACGYCRQTPIRKIKIEGGPWD